MFSIRLAAGIVAVLVAAWSVTAQAQAINVEKWPVTFRVIASRNISEPSDLLTSDHTTFIRPFFDVDRLACAVHRPSGHQDATMPAANRIENIGTPFAPGRASLHIATRFPNPTRMPAFCG